MRYQLLNRRCKLTNKLSAQKALNLRRALNLVANIHAVKEDAQKAEPLYLRALEIREKVIGYRNILQLLKHAVDLASFYNATENDAKAESFASARCNDSRERSRQRSLSHRICIDGLWQLSSWFPKFRKSEEVLNRSVFILQNSVGEDHPKYARALHSLGYLYDTKVI